MGKNFNPVDAHRKAQRAKELKKNKDARKDKRENQLVKKDTRDIENEIKVLKAEGKLNDGLKARLEELQKELKYITSVKEKYVKDHPEAKDQVFKPRGGGGQRPGHERDEEDGEDRVMVSSRDGDPMGHLYDPRTGTLRDPKRSIYYDPTYNPFGAPPPGMPYRERSVDEDSDDDDDESDDDIVMPEGPRPDACSDSDDSDDSDDIPLPAGPPPPKMLPPIAAPIHQTGYTGFATPMQARPPPMHQPPHHYRPPSAQFRPPPANLPTRPPAGSHGLPARPPQAGPSTSGSAGIISAQPSITAPTTTASTISAEPQMRDLRKEATVFVPRGIKRKKGTTTVNATPGGGEVDEDGDSVRVRRDDGPGLLGKLQSVLGDRPKDTNANANRGGAGTGDDDYQNFLKGLGDLS